MPDSQIPVATRNLNLDSVRSGAAGRSASEGRDVAGWAWRGYKGLVVMCPRCGASRGDGDRFCADCGAPLGGCPSCGEPVVPGQRFCRACGCELGGADQAEAKPHREPVAERRVCSVLFCDVVGFTTLSESRDPEAVRELLSEYFRVARTVIERYGGVVEKFIGDAVMAEIGTPVAVEGDAERAVRAGL